MNLTLLAALASATLREAGVSGDALAEKRLFREHRAEEPQVEAEPAAQPVASEALEPSAEFASLLEQADTDQDGTLSVEEVRARWASDFETERGLDRIPSPFLSLLEVGDRNKNGRIDPEEVAWLRAGTKQAMETAGRAWASLLDEDAAGAAEAGEGASVWMVSEDMLCQRYLVLEYTDAAGTLVTQSTKGARRFGADGSAAPLDADEQTWYTVRNARIPGDATGIRIWFGVVGGHEPLYAVARNEDGSAGAWKNERQIYSFSKTSEIQENEFHLAGPSLHCYVFSATVHASGARVSAPTRPDPNPRPPGVPTWNNRHLYDWSNFNAEHDAFLANEGTGDRFPYAGTAEGVGDFMLDSWKVAHAVKTTVLNNFWGHDVHGTRTQARLHAALGGANRVDDSLLEQVDGQLSLDEVKAQWAKDFKRELELDHIPAPVLSLLEESDADKNGHVDRKEMGYLFSHMGGVMSKVVSMVMGGHEGRHEGRLKADLDALAAK